MKIRHRGVRLRCPREGCGHRQREIASCNTRPKTSDKFELRAKRSVDAQGRLVAGRTGACRLVIAGVLLWLFVFVSASFRRLGVRGEWPSLRAPLLRAKARLRGMHESKEYVNVRAPSEYPKHEPTAGLDDLGRDEHEGVEKRAKVASLDEFVGEPIGFGQVTEPVI